MVTVFGLRGLSGQRISKDLTKCFYLNGDRVHYDLTGSHRIDQDTHRITLLFSGVASEAHKCEEKPMKIYGFRMSLKIVNISR